MIKHLTFSSLFMWTLVSLAGCASDQPQTTTTSTTTEEITDVQPVNTTATTTTEQTTAHPVSQ